MVRSLTHGRLGQVLGASAMLVALAACRQDMHDQPKYRGLRASDFFADGKSARPLVANTVARGLLNEDALLTTGKDGDVDSTVFPFPVTEDVMARGQERFNIYCSPCHGRTGNGDGMVVRRGFKRPPAFTDDRLMTAPVGHYFDVMTNGLGQMPDYQAQVSVADRWAIAAYIKALQLAAAAPLDVVPAADRGRLDETPPRRPETPAAESERR